LPIPLHSSKYISDKQ